MSTAVMPEHVTSQPSKRPIYDEAYRLYVETDNPSLFAIAQRVGLRPDALVHRATNQNWAGRKATLVTQSLANTAETRIATSLLVDQLVVKAASQHVDQYSNALAELTKTILDLETDAEDPKEHRFLVRQKLSLMHDASKCFRELVDIGCSVGLVKAERGDPDGKAGKLDMSKLTQLNVTINAALVGHEKAPIPVKEIGALEVSESESESEDVI